MSRYRSRIIEIQTTVKSTDRHPDLEKLRRSPDTPPIDSSPQEAYCINSTPRIIPPLANHTEVEYFFKTVESSDIRLSWPNECNTFVVGYPAIARAIIASELSRYIKSVTVFAEGKVVTLSGEYLRVSNLLAGRGSHYIELADQFPAIPCHLPIRVLVSVDDERLTLPNMCQALLQVTPLSPDVCDIITYYTDMELEVDMTTHLQFNSGCDDPRAPPRPSYRVVDTVCDVVTQSHIVRLPHVTQFYKMIFWYTAPETQYCDILSHGMLTWDGQTYPFSREVVLTMDKIMNGAAVPMMAGFAVPIYTLTVDSLMASDEKRDRVPELSLHTVAALAPGVRLNIVLLVSQQSGLSAEESMEQWHAYGSSYETMLLERQDIPSSVLDYDTDAGRIAELLADRVSIHHG